LSLATAWRLVSDGQTVLIYCPERGSVEPFANVIVDLHSRGALPSLLSKYPPAEPGALGIGPLEAAVRIADAILHLLAT
jgi:hypothetical protein